MNYLKSVFCNNNGYLGFHQKMKPLSGFMKTKHDLVEIHLPQCVYLLSYKYRDFCAQWLEISQK